jgi:hypothetical protein
LRSPFTNHLLFCFRTRVYPRPSLPRDSPVYCRWRGLFPRNVTLGASTFGALKNIMDESRFLDFLAGKFHPGNALNAEGFVGLYKWLDHVAILAKRKTRVLHKCRGVSRVFQRPAEF